MTTHPDARCGQCKNCKHVEATKSIVLSHSAPAGPGITQRETDLWNTTLQENPCINPLVLVVVNHHIVTGRILSQYEPPGEARKITVNTAHFGQVVVMADQVTDWTPERALDGINFDVLAAGLANMPMTWYPALLATITRAAIAKNVFTQHGASLTVQRIEDEEAAKQPLPAANTNGT